MNQCDPVEFGEALPPGTRLTLFSDDKPDRFFRVIKFWLDETSGIELALKTGVPSYQVEDEEGRIHLLFHLPIEEEEENRWCLGRPDQAGFDSRSIWSSKCLAFIPRPEGTCILYLLRYLRECRQRRAKAAGIETRFRATGITAYLKNSGKPEVAQQIANHESPRTTKLYDRRHDEISLDEVERIAI